MLLFFFVLPRYTVSKLLPVELFHLNMKYRDWSRALLYDFIHLYEYHKCLWLLKDPYYYNKRQKTESYIELVHLAQSDFPNADVLFVKNKIKNIRNAFRKEYKKKQMKFRQGIIYVPKLW